MAVPESGPDRRATGLRRFLRRLTATEHELDAEDLQRSSAAHGSIRVCDCPRGQQVAVSGRLRSVVYTPRTTLPTVEAELFDGSGAVMLVWLGRRRIPGIDPGRSLSARGRIAVQGDRKIIYNPYYELAPVAP